MEHIFSPKILSEQKLWPRWDNFYMNVIEKNTILWSSSLSRAQNAGCSAFGLIISRSGNRAAFDACILYEVDSCSQRAGSAAGAAGGRNCGEGFALCLSLHTYITYMHALLHCRLSIKWCLMLFALWCSAFRREHRHFNIIHKAKCSAFII